MAQNLRRFVLSAVLALVLALFSHSAHAAFTEATYNANYLFLSAFPVAFSSLRNTWTGTEFCSWPGVTCDNTTNVNTTYISVDLAGTGLSGSMPRLRNTVTRTNLLVVSIDLSGNPGLSGAFSSEWAALYRLQTLDLSSTSLTGAIPSAWTAMKNLVTVKLSNTKACKDLPSWNISTLRVVDLSSNRLRGTLASSWGGMRALTSVNLAGNAFCGCVPDSWANSTVLTNAAAALGGNLVSANCNTANRCGSENYLCRDAATAPASKASVVAALLSLFVALAVAL